MKEVSFYCLSIACVWWLEKPPTPLLGPPPSSCIHLPSYKSFLEKIGEIKGNTTAGRKSFSHLISYFRVGCLQKK